MTLPMHTLAGTVLELCSYCDGYYLVTTQGSTHLWHPSEGRYMRIPGDESKAVGVRAGDNNVWLEPQVIVRWPSVDQSFYVINEGGRFHKSSRIVSIEPVTKHGLPKDES